MEEEWQAHNMIKCEEMGQKAADCEEEEDKGRGLLLLMCQ